MTTFGLPVDSYECIPPGDASRRMPQIFMESDSQLSPFENHSASPMLPEDSASQSIDNQFAENGCPDSDYPLIATQQLTQSQHVTYDPEIEQHLVGCLIPATAKCTSYELCKSKEGHQWKIGRHETNDITLPGLRISNLHCTLIWNGKQGRQSEVKLEDHSTNGTWINNVYVTNGQKCILRSGAAISLGAAPDVPSNDYRFIFRDVEGQSTRHANQIWARYDVGHELGAGAFARVHRCIERATGLEYAVKIIDKKKLHRSNVSEQAVIREIVILQQLAEFRHKNIVSLHEHFEEEDSIYLVLELVGGGDLLTYITSHGPLPEDQVRRMAAQICHAVAYVHSQGITHRDLKPENIMMTATDPPDCKVADFGLAKLVDNNTFLKTQCGTPAYLAPEVMLRVDARQAYDSRVDTWSLGIIFYCMLTNCAPFHEGHPRGDEAELKRYFGTRQVDWDVLHNSNLSHDCLDFVRNMLVEDPRNRKTVTHMLDHHWISHLVPTDSQFQRAPSPPSGSSATPPTTDGALACSQSMENLNLSEIPIPGLSMIDHLAAKNLGAMDVSSDNVHQSMESVPSEISVTAQIPGAFPKAKRVPAPRLAVVEESGVESASLDSSVSLVATGAPGVSRRTASPTTLPTKRKNNLIAGSSPLSSLSSDSEEDGDTPKKLVTRRGVAPKKNKGKAVETPGNKRKTRPPSSTTKIRRAAPTDGEEHGMRKSSRRPAAKTPRYA